MKKIYVSLFLSSLAIAALLCYTTFNSPRNESPQPKVKVIVKEIPLKKVAPEEIQKAEGKSDSRNTGIQQTSFLQAPLKKAIIPFKKLTISASSPSTLTSPRGTEIIIPENAFLDEAGNIVQGNVELQYREFHDHTDIFLSGIPMTYESGQLESAGMIEITASLNNKPVFVNPLSKIKINIPSSNQDPDFNLYYLDEKEKRWKLREENLNPAKNSQDEIPGSEIESTKGSFKINDDVYYDTYRELTVANKNKKINMDGKMVKLIEPQFLSGNYYELDVDLKNYPELSIYNNVKWQTIDSKRKRAVASVFPKKMDMVGKPIVKILHRMGDSDSFKIRVAGSTNSVDIIFQPVFQDHDIGMANRTYRKLLLANAGTIEEVVKEITNETKRENTEALVKRSFAIDGFGIWNCDRIVKNTNSRTISVKLIRSDNQEEIKGTFYFADKNKNTVYGFYPGYLKNVTYNPSSTNLLWVILDAGKIAVFNANDFKKLDDNQEQTLTMKILEQEIKSADDVKKILESI